MTLGELVIPSHSLDYGVYQIKLTVAMTVSSQLTASVVTYVSIIRSPITVNLLQLGSSMIIHGQQQTLTLDPGSFSVDPDSTTFFDISVCVSFLSGGHSRFLSCRAGTTLISVASTASHQDRKSVV